MGLLLKVSAFVVGVSLLGLGAGLLAAPFLIYAIWGVIFRRRKSAGEKGKARPTLRVSRKGVAGSVLLGLAALAAAQGGRLSVLVFGGAAVFLLSWNRIGAPGWAKAVRPVGGSVVLRSRALPFAWYSVSEVKLLTKNAAGALSALEGEMVIVTTGKPSVLSVARVFALTGRSAVEGVNELLRGRATALMRAGGYLVPLDSEDAAALLSEPLERLRMCGRDWRSSLRSGPFDRIVVRPKAGYVEAVGLYRSAAAKEGTPRLATAGDRLGVSPLMWELIKGMDEIVSWPEPDDVTGYVASLGARRGEPLAERLPKGTVGDDSVRVEVMSGRTVELKATQLRALIQLYR